MLTLSNKYYTDCPVLATHTHTHTPTHLYIYFIIKQCCWNGWQDNVEDNPGWRICDEQLISLIYIYIYVIYIYICIYSYICIHIYVQRLISLDFINLAACSSIATSK